MLRDIEALRQTRFAVAVFDEVQHIKNPQTRAYRAALRIDAPVKLGLTGTPPVENRLQGLKALMVLTVPGYLISDAAFQRRYADPVADERSVSSRRAELARFISPFTLRRLKRTVLSQLPEKIEDLRFCRLSPVQVRLYREAVGWRAAATG